MGFVLIVVVLAVFVLIGQSGAPRLIVAVRSPLPTQSSGAVADSWDLDSDIGAVMVASWRGSANWSDVRPFLVNDQIGGVLLFTANFGGEPYALREWTDRLTALASSSCFDHPLLVMLDEEGARWLT